MDYHRAGMEARVVGSYNPARSAFSPFSGWDERDEVEEAAYRRWRGGMKAMGVFGGVVENVACHDAMPCAAQVAALRAGLGLLVGYYRMEG